MIETNVDNLSSTKGSRTYSLPPPCPRPPCRQLLALVVDVWGIQRCTLWGALSSTFETRRRLPPPQIRMMCHTLARGAGG